MSVERLNQSSDKIMESRRTMLETEELGVSILQDLHQQRETLLHSHKKVYLLLDVHFSYGSLWLKLVWNSHAVEDQSMGLFIFYTRLQTQV